MVTFTVDFFEAHPNYCIWMNWMDKWKGVYVDDQILLSLENTLHDLMLVCRIIVTVWDTFTCPDGKVGQY